MVLKQDMVRLFTCPICNKLYDHPTNISECNHIFCRRCIEEKLTVENLRACPVCNVDLGVSPLDNFLNILPDNKWDDLKQKVFKSEQVTVKAATKTSLKYSRKKKKSQTEVSTPPEPLELKKLGKQMKDVSMNQSSAIPVSNVRRSRRNETRVEPEPKKLGKKNSVLAGASTSKGCIQKENNSGKDKEEIPISSDDLGMSLSTIGDKGKEKAYFPPVLRPRKHRDMSSGGTSSQPEKKVEASNNKIWLSLIAARNQNTDRPVLPQISASYIRTDGNLTVSSVKKYIVKKLGLESENEVEISLRQEQVCSTQKLHDLVDWWVQTTPIADRKIGMVGRSGAEFVMDLHYSGSYLFE